MYKYLIGKLIYIAVTHLDIAYAVGVCSQFMAKLRGIHFAATFTILEYVKESPGMGYFRQDCHLRMGLIQMLVMRMIKVMTFYI